MGNTILIVGGMGYLGAHCVRELVNSGYEVVVLDEATANPQVVTAIETLTGVTIPAYYVDLQDKRALREVFKGHEISGVMVASSPEDDCKFSGKPLECYAETTGKLLSLLEVMAEEKVFTLVFRSSASVQAELPVSPWAIRTRAMEMAETIVRDVCEWERKWKGVVVRCPELLGATEDGELGEDPRNFDFSIMDYLLRVVDKKSHKFIVRDEIKRQYVHVRDAARAMCLAMDRLLKGEITFEVVNLGSESAYTLEEVLHRFEEVTGTTIPFYQPANRAIADRDVPVVGVDEAAEILDWRPQYSLEDMCAHSWKWYVAHPLGYSDIPEESSLSEQIDTFAHDQELPEFKAWLARIEQVRADGELVKKIPGLDPHAPFSEESLVAAECYFVAHEAAMSEEMLELYEILIGEAIIHYSGGKWVFYNTYTKSGRWHAVLSAEDRQATFPKNFLRFALKGNGSLWSHEAVTFGS